VVPEAVITRPNGPSFGDISAQGILHHSFIHHRILVVLYSRVSRQQRFSSSIQ
jgi:hypothetical protein